MLKHTTSKSKNVQKTSEHIADKRNTTNCSLMKQHVIEIKGNNVLLDCDLKLSIWSLVYTRIKSSANVDMLYFLSNMFQMTHFFLFVY